MRGSSAGVLGRISEVQLLDVPEDIRFENGGMKIAKGVLRACQNVRACQKNHRLIFGEDLLHAGEIIFPLLVPWRSELLLHQLVDLCLPLRRRMRWPRVPKGRAAA